MLGIAEQRLDRRLLDDLAAVHHGDAVGHLGDDAEVVGDQHDARAAIGLQLAHQVEDLRLDRDVERGGRLVGDQQLGLGGERHRDHHALRLAARELVRERLGPPRRVGDADRAQHLDRLLDAGLAAGVAVDLVDLADLHAGGVARVQAGVGLLEHHRDAVAADRVQACAASVDEVDAVERARVPDTMRPGLSTSRSTDSIVTLLPLAGLADEAEHLAAADGEVDAVDGVDVAAACVEPRAQSATPRAAAAPSPEAAR